MASESDWYCMQVRLRQMLDFVASMETKKTSKNVCQQLNLFFDYENILIESLPK